MGSITGEERHLENGDSSLLMSPPNHKRRKVSASRDFPHGCGPNAARITMRTNMVGNDGPKEGVFVRDVDDGGDACDVGRKHSQEEMGQAGDIDEASGLEKCGKLVNSNVEPLNMSARNLNTKEDIRSTETETVLLHTKYDSSKDLMEVRVLSPSTVMDAAIVDCREAVDDTKSKVVEGSIVQLTSLPHHPIPSNIVWKEHEFPSRKTVSAVRDFPAGCGRILRRPIQTENEHVSENATDTKIHEPTALSHVGGKRDADTVSNDEIQAAGSGKSWYPLDKPSSSDEVPTEQMIVQAPVFCSIDQMKGQEKILEDGNDNQQGKEMQQPEYCGNGERDMGGSSHQDTLVYVMDILNKKTSNDISSSNTEMQENCIAGVGNEKRIIVQCLMSASSCPWRQGKRPVTTRPSSVREKGNKRKNNNSAAPNKRKRSLDSGKDKAEKGAEKSMVIVPYLKGTETDVTFGPLALSDEDDASENEEPDDFHVRPRKPDYDVNLPPSLASSSSERGTRSKVRETLRLFQTVVRKLIQEETKLKDKDKYGRRIDIRAAGVLKDNGKYINTHKMIGDVPGVEIGDIFSYRIELAIIGLHSPLQGGIDSTKKGKKSVAISIVASGGYDNDVDSSDILIYTGQGGNPTGADKQPEDQKLERGNLALKNSYDEKTPVRVIRGFKEAKPSAESVEGKAKTVATYTYDGLYTVEKYWHDLGPQGKLVYKFKLRRIPGQRELGWKEVKQSKKFKVREGRCVHDISQGKENPPICAVNTIDDEKPPPFTYITSMMYPDWCKPLPPKGCDCKNGCFDSKRCACGVRNGGEIPYNLDGAIVEAKPLVYECGPSCKCPPSCSNRVSQHGIKLPLEIFKTDTRGWGVRCLSSIPSGSFICEYIGELLDDKEAEQRTGSDEYLFDIGQNYKDQAVSNGLSALMPDMLPSSSDVVEIGFTIDAASYGNIGRFINHSCTPNLYAQDVLYDHEDKRIPHIMLFAAENIPPLEELTYHYNYTIDTVFDSDGNIKRKNCYCGSAECTGRMY